jgi:hypothetical protein
VKIDNKKFNEGMGRWFDVDDYPTEDHYKTPDNGALWFWIWFSSFRNGSNGCGEQKLNGWKSLRATSIKTRKEFCRALRDLEILGLIEIVKISNASYKDDIIKIKNTEALPAHLPGRIGP